MGKKSQQTGETLESLLNFIHTLYWNREKVWIRHNGIAGTFHNTPRGRVFAPISRQAAPDYYGCIDGRMVAFDAKTTQAKNVWRMPADRIHQREELLDLQAAGALAWFAVECRPRTTLFLLPPKEGVWPTIDFRDPDPGVLTVPWSERLGGYDWLTAVKSW